MNDLIDPTIILHSPKTSSKIIQVLVGTKENFLGLKETFKSKLSFLDQQTLKIKGQVALEHRNSNTLESTK